MAGLPALLSTLPRLARSGAIRSANPSARSISIPPPPSSSTPGALAQLVGSALTTTQPSTATSRANAAAETSNRADGATTTDLEARAWRESGERLLREIFSPPPGSGGGAGGTGGGTRGGNSLPSMLLAGGDSSRENEVMGPFTRMGSRMIVMSSTVNGEAGVRSAFIRIIAGTRTAAGEAPATPPTATARSGEGGLTPPTNSLRSAYASPGWPYRASSRPREAEQDSQVVEPMRALVVQGSAAGEDDEAEGGRRNRRRLNENQSIGR